MTSSPVVYLDQGFEVWGSGYNPFEPVLVQVQIGSGVGETATFGVVDANAGGAFRMVLTADEVNGKLGGKADQLIAEGALTLKGIGTDGSSGSTAIRVVAETPAPEAVAEPPSVAASMTIGNIAADGSFQAGVVAKGGELNIFGAGFEPNEHAGLFTVKAISGSSLTEQTITGTSLSRLDNATTDKTGAFLAVIPEVGLDEGLYTLKAVGIFGTIATSPLWVTKAAE
jgi:hypothetical protein